MLVLEYGIECDLMKDGNIRVVDGEIEITSEEFLRNLSIRLGFELTHVFLCTECEIGTPSIVAEYVSFDEGRFACLDIALTTEERHCI